MEHLAFDMYEKIRILNDQDRTKAMRSIIKAVKALLIEGRSTGISEDFNIQIELLLLLINFEGASITANLFKDVMNNPESPNSKILSIKSKIEETTPDTPTESCISATNLRYWHCAPKKTRERIITECLAKNTITDPEKKRYLIGESISLYMSGKLD